MCVAFKCSTVSYSDIAGFWIRKFGIHWSLLLKLKKKSFQDSPPKTPFMSWNFEIRNVSFYFEGDPGTNVCFCLVLLHFTRMRRPQLTMGIGRKTAYKKIYFFNVNRVWWQYIFCQHMRKKVLGTHRDRALTSGYPALCVLLKWMGYIDERKKLFVKCHCFAMKVFSVISYHLLTICARKISRIDIKYVDGLLTL